MTKNVGGNSMKSIYFSISYRHRKTELFQEKSVYHVRQFYKRQPTFWESFSSLRDARERFRSAVK